MEKITSDEAYKLLIKDVIFSDSDYQKKENRWINHCIYTGLGAERIATYLGIDSDYAKALGYIHDIGRKINHVKHTTEGYKYMQENNYPEAAKICLTHSFVNNDIEAVAGGSLQGIRAYDYINNFLMTNPCTIYDNIIQMCDLFCLETGFTTVEKRMLDITKRKGVHSNSKYHWNQVKLLRTDLESMLGCNLYDLFPEMVTDIETETEDRNNLEEMLNQKIKKK